MGDGKYWDGGTDHGRLDIDHRAYIAHIYVVCQELTGVVCGSGVRNLNFAAFISVVESTRRTSTRGKHAEALKEEATQGKG